MSTLAPNDANIVYSPYTWDVTGARAMTINAGAYLRLALNAAPTDLVATFDLTGVANRPPVIHIRVNRGPIIRRRIAASVPIPLPTGWTEWPTDTEIEILFAANGQATERWATQGSAVKFTGLSSDSTTLATLPVERLPLRGFVLGDSILEGVRTLTLADSTPDDAPFSGSSADLAWGLPLREALGAEIGVCGFGGVGLTKTGDQSVPKFGTIWNQLWDGKARDFSAAPDFIAMMVGTNDGASTSAAVTSENVALLNAMLAATPATTRIFQIRPFAGTWGAVLQASIASCSAPQRVTWVDTTGWWNSADSSDTIHPYGYANTRVNVPRIAAAIRARLGGSSGRYIYNGTTFVAR